MIDIIEVIYFNEKYTLKIAAKGWNNLNFIQKIFLNPGIVFSVQYYSLTFMFGLKSIYELAQSWGLISINYEFQGESERPVTSDDLSRLPYLSRVIKETLRITPPVPGLSRELDEDIVVGKSVFL